MSAIVPFLSMTGLSREVAQTVFINGSVRNSRHQQSDMLKKGIRAH